MYLDRIGEAEKVLFLQLAKAVCEADGSYGDAEKLMVQAYCREMQIEDKKESVSKSVEEIMKDLAALSDEKESRMIVFELVGLAYADKMFSSQERELISKLTKIFNIEDSYIQKCEGVIKQYLHIQAKMNQLVFQ